VEPEKGYLYNFCAKLFNVARGVAAEVAKVTDEEKVTD